MGGAVGGVAAELADASFEAAISAENFIFGENEPTMQFVSSSMIIDPVILRLIIVCSAYYIISAPSLPQRLKKPWFSIKKENLMLQ